MSKITLYKEPDLKGESQSIEMSMSDLNAVGFSNVARSAKVVGKHWVAFKEIDYKGDFFVLGEGSHLKLRLLDREISSLRLVKEDLTSPKIVLYEDTNFKGKGGNILTKVDDLRNSNFDKLVASHKVDRGVWILHEEIDQTGLRLITFQEDEWPNYYDYGWKSKLSSLRPLLEGDFEV